MIFEIQFEGITAKGERWANVHRVAADPTIVLIRSLIVSVADCPLVLARVRFAPDGTPEPKAGAE